ncbi:hypothetical protein [Gordonia soli]|uniref:DUF4386 family protein n=1 Tax=Gordonia soli NBRC 108243 TaxID=1223545 RepID=M0QGF4_9ACTN|nr:hypothetical protein [Gordonia soli]GAC66477.1 hypothetical protein GS4_02_01880 [Gordonia soli NBRC 108243]
MTQHIASQTGTTAPESDATGGRSATGSARRTGAPTWATIRRLSGTALTLGGIACIAGGSLHPIIAGESHSVAALHGAGAPWAQALLAVGTTLLLLGLPGMYAWLAPRIGVVGFVGVIAYAVGNLVTATGHLIVELFVAYPFAHDPATAHLIADDDSMLGTTGFAALNTVGGLVMLAGMAMLGASLIRNRAVPLWIGVLTLVGMIGFFLPIPAIAGMSGFIYEAPRGIAVAAIGVLMLRDWRAATR